jgi:hypothetical protein
MIVERDGVQLHLHPSNEPPTNEPPTRHGAFWIRVSNIEALYQEYLASPLFRDNQVCGVGRRNAIGTRIAERGQVETSEEILARAEKDR